MGIVYLRDLRVETIIGIFDWERTTRQVVGIDLEMAADVARAAATDSIDDALDYKAISKRLIDAVSNSSFQLIETLAEEIARIVREEFGVSWVKVTVAKPGAIRGARDVGVVIERSG
ncbi:MAG: dihydroneopterin aldolase [Halofilum sp. (in: g-proteobacteria)]